MSPSAAQGAQRRPRATRQLDATLRVLLGSDQHPTAEQVLHAVRAELPAVSRGTVYRNLAKLVATERECCPWASLPVAAAADAVALEIRSQGDGVAALRSMLATTPA